MKILPSKGRLSRGRQHVACYARLGCIVERSGTDISHTLSSFLFQTNRISPTNRSVVMHTEPKASYRTVQYEYAYHYTPIIYIYIYIYIYYILYIYTWEYLGFDYEKRFDYVWVLSYSIIQIKSRCVLLTNQIYCCRLQRVTKVTLRDVISFRHEVHEHVAKENLWVFQKP